MKNTKLVALLALAVVGSLAGALRADPISDAINAASANLRSTQDGTTHNWTGTGADGYNGTIVAGLINAYQATGNAADLTSAQMGASAIISNVNAHQGGVFLGDEAFSVVQVSNLQSNPTSNVYHDAVYNFFNTTVPTNYGSTTGYVNALVNAYAPDKTQATVYLSYYTLAAYQLNLPAQIQTDLRNGLIATLGQVADLNSANGAQTLPTGALGAAVWALSQTGNGLDHTAITGPSTGQNVFGGHYLDDLPGMLDARLDSTTHVFGYDLLSTSVYDGATDADALAVLGLSAAEQANPSLPYAADVAAARMALASAVDTGTGGTSAYVTYPDYLPMDVYSGRTLQALQPVPEPAAMGVMVLGAAALLRRRRKMA